MGLYDDQQCKDIINEKSPWEVVKGPNEEVAISSRYAVFYRNGSLDEVQATNSFGDRGSVIDLFPTCHWIFNIPEGSKSVYSICKTITLLKNIRNSRIDSILNF